MNPERWHLFRSHDVEVGTGDPGYRWVDGWAQVREGGVSNTMPAKEWRAMAKRDGAICLWYGSEAAARQAEGGSK